MDDLISRQAAVDAIEKMKDCNAKGTIGTFYNIVLQKSIKVIAKLPSAQPYTDEEIQKIQELEQAEIQKAFQLGMEDALSEIIRCKDCKHSEFWYRDKRRCFLWHEEGIDVFEDGFCNYAERGTDE